MRGSVAAQAMIPMMNSVLAGALGRNVEISEDGRFELKGLVPGRFRLRYTHEDAAVEAQIELREGQRYRWDPAFVDRSLQLRIVDSRRRPIPNARVVLTPVAELETSRGRSRACDEEGRVAFFAVCADEHELRVHFDGCRFVSHVERLRWRDGEVEVVVPDDCHPSVTLRGSVELAGLKHDTIALVVRRILTGPVAVGMGQLVLQVDQQGKFEHRFVPPGRYMVSFRVGRRPLGFSKRRSAAKGETIDFGRLEQLRAGSVLVVVPERARAGLEVYVRVDRAGSPRPARFRRVKTEEHAAGLLIPMVPTMGFDLLVQGYAFRSFEQRVQVRAGVRERVTVPIHAATPCSLYLEAPAKLLGGRVDVPVSVRNASGRVVLATRLSTAPDEAVVRGLAAGDYRAQIRIGAKVYETSFSVPEKAEHRVTLRVSGSGG